ncbi:superinfection exclusion B family protein [Listeria booriae]|uniref:superinfection exclusion B family protein n=1 Tax=Listeria booriae TaxID=1552123 RepID=UPI0016274D23|nr:superinfection exclusion B family protein [Listeria booriae]MBC2305887.1 hypothetical protein [Listeria booriae]
MKVDFNIADFFKLPNKIMGALSLASGMMLFSPNSLVEKMYMTDFRDKYGFAIGLVFITAFSILTISLLLTIIKYFRNKYYMKKFEESAKPRLQALDTYQKVLIYDLFIEDNHTDELPLHDGAVNFLEHNMMIGKATTQYIVSDLNNAFFPYMLQPWVIQKLQEDSELQESFKIAFQEYEKKVQKEYDENKYSSYNEFY